MCDGHYNQERTQMATETICTESYYKVVLRRINNSQIYATKMPLGFKRIERNKVARS